MSDDIQDIIEFLSELCNDAAADLQEGCSPLPSPLGEYNQWIGTLEHLAARIAELEAKIRHRERQLADFVGRLDDAETTIRVRDMRIAELEATNKTFAMTPEIAEQIRILVNVVSFKIVEEHFHQVARKVTAWLDKLEAHE